MPEYEYAIVGGGIVGLSTAYALKRAQPGAAVILLEKERRVAAHQTGHNSGVIHSGIYYKPDSFKARLTQLGNSSMQAFCRNHGIPFEMCGKVIVATREAERSQLEALHERGVANGLDVELLDRAGLRAIEPHVEGVAAIHVPAAGIVNYTTVCETLMALVEDAGGRVLLGAPVTCVKEDANGVRIKTGAGPITARRLINCAGLYSDRVARLSGVDAGCQIVPFRGEYYKLRPEARSLVRNLVYPVPDPKFPFLGVHFTRTMDGEVEAGPNAVLAFAREGYRKRDINLSELASMFAFPGFWIMARRHWRQGAAEMWRSWSKAAFLNNLRRLIPDLDAADIEAAPAGIRAQALAVDGALVDDFHIVRGQSSIHVLNAPSPAATASLEIGRYVAALLT